MARYVDVEGKTFPTSHRKILNDYMNGWNTCLKSILQQPTADVVEVRHGEWIDLNTIEWQCSECNYRVMRWNNTPYCPRCGAKMDKREEENIKE